MICMLNIILQFDMHSRLSLFRPVNVVITPQRIIYTQNKFSCPKAINWNDVDNETMLNLPVLKEFKRLQQLHHEI
jgi:hypothetical protein